MLVDWFTIIAQIVNFLILMVLLKIFLYDRIVRAMEEREEKIRSRLQEAENTKTEAEREEEKLRERNRILTKSAKSLWLRPRKRRKTDAVGTRAAGPGRGGKPKESLAGRRPKRETIVSSRPSKAGESAGLRYNPPCAERSCG